MPNIHFKVKNKDGSEWECDAKGWFLCSLTLNSHPKSQLRKRITNMIREYDYPEEKDVKDNGKAYS